MKELNFSRDSWHYKLAQMGEYNPGRPDFCHYVRSVLLGGFFFFILCTFALAGIVCLGDFIAYIVAAYTTGLWFKLQPDLGAQIIICLLIFSAVIGALITIFLYKEKRREAKADRLRAAMALGEEMKEPEPGFIGHAYKSLKEKTCFKVKLK